MQALLRLSALIATAPALAYIPIHGCEWVPETTTITNFTFTEDTSTDGAPDYVAWRAPAVGVSCSGSRTSFQDPSASTAIRCTAPASDPTVGVFLVSVDDGSGSNATLRFVVYEQCAASIYAFYYQGDFPLACGIQGENATCAPKSDAAATVISQLYLPPVGPPPPPPHQI